MNTITWLHISDLHFRRDNSAQDSHAFNAGIVLEKLLEDIEENIKECKLYPNFIIVSGDITFSSNPEEYSLAKGFFDKLLKVANVPKTRLFLVPGNHDVDRNAISPLSFNAIDILSNSNLVNSLLANESDRRLIMSRFHNYQKFVNEYLGEDGFHFDENDYFYSREVDISGRKIAILGLNSSWTSCSNSDRGRLLVGEYQVQKAIEISQNVDLRIAVLHHPFEWLKEFDRKAIRSFLSNKCNFILQGHLHETDILQAITPDSNAMIITTGACYETREYPNSYNFVQLNLDKGKGSIYLRMYSNQSVGFWTKDVMSYKNVTDGIYSFIFSDNLSRSLRVQKDEKEAETLREVETRREEILEPFFGNPYDLKENFSGRIEERKILTKWLFGINRPILLLSALGGMGKSSLAWVWLQNDILGKSLTGLVIDTTEDIEIQKISKEIKFEGIFWWSFYESDISFEKFLDEALIYTKRNSSEKFIKLSTNDKVQNLVDILRKHKFLLVLDGFERELRAYATLDSSYQGDSTKNTERNLRRCTSIYADKFLRWISGTPLESRILLISRDRPLEIEGSINCELLELNGLDINDAIKFLKSCKIRGRTEELGDVCKYYECHPLTLRILAGLLVSDPHYPLDIRAAPFCDPIPKLEQREHHILEFACSKLDTLQKELLSRLSAYRSMVNYEAVKVISPYDSDDDLKECLRELEKRNLISFSKQKRTYDLHQVVREYAYKVLIDKETIHIKLKEFYSLKENPETIQTLSDLENIIELYHHTISAGLYEEAFSIYSSRLSKYIPERFGAYPMHIKILRAFFPDGEDLPPKLKIKNNQGKILNDLAISFGLSGQPSQARTSLEMALTLAENDKDRSTGLCNLAAEQIVLGDFSKAEKNLVNSINISNKIRYKFNEGMGCLWLCKLYTYMGNFIEAQKELDQAEKLNLKSLKNNSKYLIPGTVNAYRTFIILKMINPSQRQLSIALGNASKALNLASKFTKGLEPIIIEIRLLHSLSLLAVGSIQRSKSTDFIEKAENHLRITTELCHKANLVEQELDIMLAWAKLNYAKGNIQSTHDYLTEALHMADRCEYRIKKAEIHNFNARVSFESGDYESAKKYSIAALNAALCEKKPYYYKTVLDEAESLLYKLE